MVMGSVAVEAFGLGLLVRQLHEHRLELRIRELVPNVQCRHFDGGIRPANRLVEERLGTLRIARGDGPQ